jgi:sugar phosphate isomerase/epimerase
VAPLLVLPPVPFGTPAPNALPDPVRMEFGLTTHWNASRHTTGEALIEEILGLGFRRVELGYDLRMDLVPGVQKMVAEGAVKVDSLHNYCPVPVGAPKGHPELFTFASSDARTRESAVHHTTRTLRFAAEVGAKIVVAHAGYVDMPRLSWDLHALIEKGEQFSPLYEKTKLKLQILREKKAKAHLDHLSRCLELLVPVLDETHVTLALENLPTWEAVPTELEMENLCRQFAPKHLRCWYDMGHGQIRQNLGFINQERWLERLSPFLAGMHIHDVAHTVADHVMPPGGNTDFARMKKFAMMDILRVIEPAPNESAENIVEALKFLRRTWETPGSER